jgi:hypothetical protein
MDSTLTDVLNQAVADGLATSSQANQVLAQRSYFDSQRSSLLASYQGSTVAAANNEIFVGTDLSDVAQQIANAFAGTPYAGTVYYAEDPLTSDPPPVPVS